MLDLLDLAGIETSGNAFPGNVAGSFRQGFDGVGSDEIGSGARSVASVDCLDAEGAVHDEDCIRRGFELGAEQLF